MAFADMDDKGIHAPTLLLVLDLNMWTAILNSSTQDKDESFKRIKQVHSKLAALLDLDELEKEEACRNTRSIEALLRQNNPHEAWTRDEQPNVPTMNLADCDTNAMINLTGFLLSRLSLENSHRSIVEEYEADIGDNIIESQREMLEASGKGPTIPFVPPRAVEELLASRGHRTWCFKNINLLAPITTSMWKTWANLSDAEIKAAEDRMLSCANILKEPAVLANAFPLALFDNHKCTTTKILIHAKQDMLTCNPRHKKFSSSFWNVGRPYIRCSCSQEANDGCKGAMLWFDHAIWFMVNTMERFFDNSYPTLTTKFAAFMTWLQHAARMVILHQITFLGLRRMMEQASLEATVNVDRKLLASYYEAQVHAKLSDISA